MVIYGTKIISDIAFPLELPQDVPSLHHVEISSAVPAELKASITCGFPLYWAHGRKVYLYSDRLFDESVEGQPWCYEAEGLLRLYWRGGERTLYYEFIGQEDAGLLAFWVIHLVLPFYLTLEGVYDFFHAGAVEVDGKPILFIAPSMGGKSTMTDYFIRQGHTLVTDDKLATFIEDGKFMAVGAHPYHRPYRKFEDLGYRVDNFSKMFKPIHAFYLLERADASASVAIEEITGFAKFEALIPNYLFAFPWLKTKRVQYLGSMLNDIRVFRVNVPWDYDRLEEVHGHICRHTNALKSFSD